MRRATGAAAPASIMSSTPATSSRSPQEANGQVVLIVGFRPAIGLFAAFEAGVQQDSNAS